MRKGDVFMAVLATFFFAALIFGMAMSSLQVSDFRQNCEEAGGHATRTNHTTLCLTDDGRVLTGK